MGPFSRRTQNTSPAGDTAAQEHEARERLYGAPPPMERTVELLGPVSAVAEPVPAEHPAA